MIERYKTTKLDIDWELEDQEEYQEVSGEQLPDYILLPESKDGYTWEELSNFVEEEEFCYGYEVMWWSVGDTGEYE